MIEQHICSPLSELDTAVAESVPPGGNWKNIPESIPLKRIQTIRESFARGEGSRSTYYGRLQADSPSYTINTYFNRPGNGCHLHYDFEGKQHRTLSYREAARLQSFPDNFIFSGNKGDWAKQIGNAVPPLLGYHIAKALPEIGQTIDLFSGAGGLGLGFKWAGWETIVGNDVIPAFADTFRNMIHGEVVCGDISDPAVRHDIVAAVSRNRDKNKPLVVLGGPPCQGFSTAGKKRSMDDPRNHLFKDYLAILDAVEPDYFVFENVPGLLSMEGGEVYKMITNLLRDKCDELEEWVLHSDAFGVPQRRNRVVLVGHSSNVKVLSPLQTHQGYGTKKVPGTDFINVKDAIGDLPPISAGEDGTNLEYLPATNNYQRFMRGQISIENFLRTN